MFYLHPIGYNSVPIGYNSVPIGYKFPPHKLMTPVLSRQKLIYILCNTLCIIVWETKWS